jgi:SRSO17 transposase
VKTQHDLAVAAGTRVDVDRWRVERDELMSQIAARFARVESFRHASGLVAGLMSDLPRKNCWTIAEHVGDTSPTAMQHLLSRASWDTDGVRDDLRDYVVAGLGEAGAVLVVDETGDVKKGVSTVGVQRQYTGTAGRIENSQVAVYLTYATDAGHAFLDRALYLPKSWTTDSDRLTAAGVPADTEFATKPALATRMIARALDAGVTASWVAGDEVYGADPQLRAELESRRVGYVLAVACSHRVDTGAGTQRADEIAQALPRRAWQRLSAGPGAKGPRVYDWALIDTDEHDDAERPGHRWLMVRRNITTGELAYYRCYSPEPVPLAILVKVAGRRWTVEESFQAGKGLCGLDEHQVRTWTSWQRWTILAMLAHAFLAVTAATERSQPVPDELIPLTCNEIQHLLNAHATPPVPNRHHRLRWSTWRRRHQHRSRLCHYQRRTPGGT